MTCVACGTGDAVIYIEFKGGGFSCGLCWRGEYRMAATMVRKEKRGWKGAQDSDGGVVE